MINKLIALKLFLCFIFLANAQLNFQDILINEIVASNDSSTGITDNNADYDDYIEIYNNTNITFLLDNYYLSDSVEFPTKWKFPNGVILNANEYLIVWCDDDSLNTKGLHTNFKLRKNGDDVTISAPNGTIIDQVIFETQQSGLAYSRTPNLSNNFTIKRCTPKASNDSQIGNFNNQIVINEFVADSDSLSNIEEIDGGFPDWIELYNNSNEDVNLFGYFLSDDGALFSKWAFAPNTIINANSFLVLFADGDVHQNFVGEIHSNFKLNKTGESIFLSYDDATIIDNITYPMQSTNISYARMPNGTGNFGFSESTYNNNNNLVININETNNLNFEIVNTSVKDFLYINLNKANQQLKIYNVNGKLMCAENINDLNFSINLSYFLPGIYFVKIENRSFKIQKI